MFLCSVTKTSTALVKNHFIPDAHLQHYMPRTFVARNLMKTSILKQHFDLDQFKVNMNIPILPTGVNIVKEKAELTA